MNSNNALKHRTPAQIIFLHSLESAGLSALLTIIVGAFQYISTQGFNVPGLGAVLGTSFVAQMAMIYKSVSANPQTAQALADTEKQLFGRAGLPSTVDTPMVARQIVNLLDLPRLASLLKDELMKLSQPTQRIPTPDVPTRPEMNAVRMSTPPVPLSPGSWSSTATAAAPGVGPGTNWSGPIPLQHGG